MSTSELKVLVDVRLLQRGLEWRGMDYYTINLLQQYRRAGRSVGLLACAGRPLVLPEGMHEFFPVHYIPEIKGWPLSKRFNWWADTYGRDAVFRQLARRYQVMHFATPHALHYGFPVGDIGAARVVTCHDLAGVQCPGLCYPFPSWAKRELYWLGYALITPTLAKCDGLICVSQSTLLTCRQFFSTLPPVRSVLEGVDPKFKPLTPAEAASFRQRMNLPEHYILQVGALTRNKNHRVVLQALQRLRQQGLEPWTYVIAGPDNKELRQEWAQFSPDVDVRWFGYAQREDLPALYASASLFVFPSLYEGFGLPVVESMASGVPVICTNTTSLPEVCAMSAGVQSAQGDSARHWEDELLPRQAAVCLNPLDVESWARALADLMAHADWRQEMTERGLRRAAQLSWERSAQATWETYEHFHELYQHKRGGLR